jgi:hypothetical protein
MSYLQHQRASHRDDGSPRSSEEKRDALIAEIINRQPDVVLKDEGLDSYIAGTEIVKIMREDPRANNIKFVANTGGSDEGFKRLGAYDNFHKGKNIEGLRLAILD